MDIDALTSSRFQVAISGRDGNRDFRFPRSRSICDVDVDVAVDVDIDVDVARATAVRASKNAPAAKM